MGFLDWEGLQKLWTKIKTHVQTSLEGYAKKTDLFSKNYNDLTNKPTIPSIEGLATEEYVDGEISTAKNNIGGLKGYTVIGDENTYLSAIVEGITSKGGDIEAYNLLTITGIGHQFLIRMLDFSSLSGIYYVNLIDLTTLKSVYDGVDVTTTKIGDLLGKQSRAIYLTEHQSLEEYAKKTDLFSKSYNDLTDKPTIPSIAGLASESYVNEKVAGVVNSAPETLDTLNELSKALGNDPNFATTIANQIGNKVEKVSGKGLSTNDYTTAEKNKLAGIAEGANNYSHPSTHPASMITGLSKVATSGNYNDLSNKPTIPSLEGYAKTSDIPSLEGYAKTSDIPDVESIQDAVDNHETRIAELEENGSSGGGSPMMLVTYAELKALRDNGELIEGMFYRITDYQCTTAQADTRATDHRFYIIVQALSPYELSETASAAYCSPFIDSYFEGNHSNLSAWELKYCLDNDTTRFAWAGYQAITNLDSVNSNGNPLTRQPACDRADQMANEEGYFYAWGTDVDVDDGDSQNFWYSKNETLVNGENVYNGGDLSPAEVIEGKGVIYYMKDEHGNECPYDFKNIQFKRMVSLENGYPELDEENGEETWVYTFCGNSYHIDNDEWSELKDGSLESPYMHQSDEHIYTFCNNTMKPYYMIYDDENEDTTKCGKQYLNNNVFFGNWEEIDSTDPENYPLYYAYACAFIEIGYECRNNTFAWGCRHIAIGNKCNDNIFSPCCVNIKLGFHCRSNKISGYDITLEGRNEDNVLYGGTLTLLKYVSVIEHNPEGAYNTIYKGDCTIV